MSTETEGKMKLPKFIKIPIILKDGRNESLMGKSEYIKSEARINPAYVMSYYPQEYTENEESHTITLVIVNGSAFWVDMPIEEFDEIINNADRSYELNISDK